MHSISIRLFYINLVGPAGFEPTTFTQEPREAVLYGFLLDTLQNFVIPLGEVSKPVACFWSPSSYLSRLRPHGAEANK